MRYFLAVDDQGPYALYRVEDEPLRHWYLDHRGEWVEDPSLARITLQGDAGPHEISEPVAEALALVLPKL